MKIYDYVCKKFEEGLSNYGEWEPVYFGKKKQGMTVFENMGCDILYRTAVQSIDGKLNHVGTPFVLTKNGLRKQMDGDLDNPLTITANKMNTGRLSEVEKGQGYTLSFLDKNAFWTILDTSICKKAGQIIFKEAPKGALYKITPLDKPGHMSRPFTYCGGKQKWY